MLKIKGVKRMRIRKLGVRLATEAERNAIAHRLIKNGRRWVKRTMRG